MFWDKSKFKLNSAEEGLGESGSVCVRRENIITSAKVLCACKMAGKVSFGRASSEALLFSNREFN